MASLKSSVASKSTADAAAPPCSDEPNALCSTWISRLRLRSLPLSSSPRPPPARSSSPSRRNTVSSLESRTPPPAKPQRRYLAPIDGFGFGPYRVQIPNSIPDHHHHRTRSWNVLETKPRSFSFLRAIAGVPYPETDEITDAGQNQINSISRDENWDGREWNGVRMSPFFQSRPMNSHRPVQIGNDTSFRRASDLSSYMWNQRVKRTVDNETQWQIDLPNVHVDPWIASTSMEHASTSRGATYPNGTENTPKSREFCDPYTLQHKIVSQHSKRQITACSNEPDEPFSYWNMGRFRRKDIVTSALPSIGLTEIPGGKRKSIMSNWLPVKCRKLGNDA